MHAQLSAQHLGRSPAKPPWPGALQGVFGGQLPEGQTEADVDIAEVMRTLCDANPLPFTYQVLNTGTWTAGYMLVAEQFRRRRFFIAGDAAHLFTPTGGMGYNTSVDDAVNLGWKLAAVVQGWAGENLLDSYFTERHPIARRNTAFARSMAESIGRAAVPADLEEPGPTGDAARAALGAALLQHSQNEYNIPGLQLGLRYESAIVAGEATPPPPDQPNVYVPSGFPGARAPHLVLEDGASLLDLFGREFTLLCLGKDAPPQAVWQEAARSLGVPLQCVVLPLDQARTLYGADLVLVRPDHHIAWRGDASVSAAAVLSLAIGVKPLPHPAMEHTA